MLWPDHQQVIRGFKSSAGRFIWSAMGGVPMIFGSFGCHCKRKSSTLTFRGIAATSGSDLDCENATSNSSLTAIGLDLLTVWEIKEFSELNPQTIVHFLQRGQQQQR